MTSTTVTSLCTLESLWTECSPTNSTLKKWKAKWEQGTTSIDSQFNMGCQYFHSTGYCPCTLLFNCRICFSCVGEIIPCKESRRLDPFNDSCRCITGCLRLTNVDSLYVLAGIALPGVRRSVASRTERRTQADDTRHSYHNHQTAPKLPEIEEELFIMQSSHYHSLLQQQG